MFILHTLRERHKSSFQVKSKVVHCSWNHVTQYNLLEVIYLEKRWESPSSSVSQYDAQWSISSWNHLNLFKTRWSATQKFRKLKMAFSKTIKNYKIRWNDFKRCVNVQVDIAHRLINLFKFLELLGNTSCSRTLQNFKKNRWYYDMRCDNLIPRMITACCWCNEPGKHLYPSISGHVPTYTFLRSKIDELFIVKQ